MIKVLLSDKDTEYGNALANAISNLHNQFEIKLFSMEDIFNKDELFFNQYDLFLIGGYSDNEIEVINSINLEKIRVVILTEYQVEDIMKQTEEQNKRFWYLYKYVEISQIITDLNYIIGYVSGKISFMRRSLHTKIIGFYSISGGVGKSVISIGTSRELSRYHDKKVLYLSFEEIPATELYIKSILNHRNIGDYLYYLLERQNEILCSHLDGFATIDEFGIEFFPSSNGRNDLNYLSKEELIYFIKFLSDSCRYDYIIFDLNNSLSEETLLLVELCSNFILVQKNSPVSVYKNQKMLTYLKKINSVRFPDYVINVINKIESFEEADSFKSLEQEMDYPSNIYIERDESSFQFLDNHLEININHSFGVGIKQITDAILLSENNNYNENLNSAVLNN